MGNVLTVAGLTVIGDPTGTYRVATGIDTGQTLPDTATLASLILDGDTITGDRTSNRTWQMTVLVFSASNRAGLSASKETLLQAINADTFPVVFTPDGCPPTIFTATGRAIVTPAKNLVQNDQLVAQVTIEFQTGPFGRSSNPQTLTVPASGGPAQIQLDGMNSGSFSGGTGVTLDAATTFEGSHSAQVALIGTHTTAGGVSVWDYVGQAGRAVPGGPVDISAMQSLSVRLRWVAPANFNSVLGYVTVTYTLTSASGTQASTASVNIGIPKADTAYRLPVISLNSLVPTLGGGVDRTAVEAWRVDIVASTPATGSAPSSHLNIDDLRAYPAGSTSNSTAEGNLLTVPGVIGSARCPVAIQVDIDGTAFTDMIVHRPPVTQDPDATILAALDGGGAVTIGAANMTYGDTFSVVGIITASGSAGRTATCTITQKISGVTIDVAALSVDLAGDATGPVVFGNVTLPLVDVPAENMAGEIDFSFVTDDASDTWSDVALLSTSGQTVLIRDLDYGVDILAAWIDEPAPGTGRGPTYVATAIDRTLAFSAARKALPSGGPMLFDPGDNQLLMLSAAGAPGVTVTYYPRWLDEAQL